MMSTESLLRWHLQTLADYHDWANALLSARLADIPQELYFAPEGLFFSSIHGTLNHILLADRAWHGRFIGKPEAFARLDLELEPERASLSRALGTRRGLWRELVANASDDRMAGDLYYTTTAGFEASRPWLGALTHVFNHATHHRGQITAVLTRHGHDSPELDLIYYLARPGPS